MNHFMIEDRAIRVPVFDEGLANLIEPGTVLERIASGFQFVEGPAWHPLMKAYIFSDIIGDRQYSWHQRGGLHVFRRPSNMTNGVAWDREGRLVMCEHATSRVSRVNLSGQYEVLASHYQGLELNSPNDIVVRRDGIVFFTDPNSGRTRRYGVERNQELGFQGVYRLDPASGELKLLTDDFSKPNGLCFSLDESRLFINDTDRQHIRVFDVTPDDELINSEVFATTGGDDPGVADGMKMDSVGNVYCCGSGGIHVFNPEGVRLGVIRTVEVAANFTWGGEHLNEIFITATHSVYRLRSKISGHLPFTPELSGQLNQERC
jgi:gluconolactonase